MCAWSRQLSIGPATRCDAVQPRWDVPKLLRIIFVLFFFVGGGGHFIILNRSQTWKCLFSLSTQLSGRLHLCKRFQQSSGFIPV